MTLRVMAHDGLEEWAPIQNSDDARRLAFHLEVGVMREGFLRVVFEDILLRKFRLFLGRGWAFKNIITPRMFSPLLLWALSFICSSLRDRGSHSSVGYRFTDL